MSGKTKACKTCEWYATFFSYKSGGKACVNKRSDKFLSSDDDSCKHWEGRNAQADSELRMILDTL